jgi:hypothetical protein
MVTGAHFIGGTYKEGRKFYEDLTRLNKTQIFIRIGGLLGLFLIFIPFLFIRTENVFIQGFLQV